MGSIGWHSMVITEQFGPRVRLACLVTEARFGVFAFTLRNGCCAAGVVSCIESCPAKALGIPGSGTAYAMNKFACRTYRQAGLTCSVCMRVCDEALRKSR